MADKFHAYNSANQSLVNNTATVLSLNTEREDTGNDFDTTTGGWTPPAGAVSMTCALHVQGATYAQCRFLKNGTPVGRAVGGTADSTGRVFFQGAYDDIANGTDVYSIDVFATEASPGSALIFAHPLQSYFDGVSYA